MSSNQEHLKMEDLDDVSQRLLDSLSDPSSGCLQDPNFLDSISLASKLLAQSFQETENILIRGSGNHVTSENIQSKLHSWQSSMKPWHELIKYVKSCGTVSCDSVEKILELLPGVIQLVFNHCKKSENLYGSKFDDVRSLLTSLYRQTDGVLSGFFSILDATVNFDFESKHHNITLTTVLDKIGDIAVLTYGMDLKTLMNTWKVFAKLATVHEEFLKKWRSTECVTRRYIDIGKHIETLLFVSLEEKKDNNYERAIKCVSLLLKILGRLCTLYRGYSGNKVSILLVQLFTKLCRYSPPFPSNHFSNVHSKIAECCQTHLVPAAIDLLKILINDKEFAKAFCQYGKSHLEEPICYHLATVNVVEELTKEEYSDFSSWLQPDDNVIDVTLENMNRCCQDILLDKLRFPVRSSVIFQDSQDSGLWDRTLIALCRLLSRLPLEGFANVEIVLLKHLCSGEFWSSLMTCDVWTYLGSISTPELCHEHVAILMKVQKNLITRSNSFEFRIVCNLIGRLYKLLPDDMQESLLYEIEDYSDRRFIDPFNKSMKPRAKEYLYRQLPIAEINNLPLIYEDLQRSPSTKNWTQLNRSLKSIGVIASLNHRVTCVVTIRDVWKFLASRISKAEGIIREMVLELTGLLFDCTQPDSSDNGSNDDSVASIFNDMAEMAENLPIHHRVRINIFLRDNLEAYINESGKKSLSAITKLFCYLANGDNPWILQELFETYTEHIIKNSSVELFDALSFGIKRLSSFCEKMQSYISNEEIYSLSHHSSLDNYLCDLAKVFQERSTWHKCYEPDFRYRDEKKPKLDFKPLDKRVDDICKEIENFTKRKNELSDESMDKLRLVLLQLLDPSV